MLEYKRKRTEATSRQMVILEKYDLVKQIVSAKIMMMLLILIMMMIIIIIIIVITIV
jgi:membrane-associated HD superfamily phosphohydrolase